MKITIDRNALKAVSRFAAIKDIRYYLQGVLIESTPLQTRLAATDGHTLAVHRADAAPMKSPQALKRIAELYEAAERLGRDGRGYRTIAEWIELKTNGARPATTAQQMISLARNAGYLEKRKPKTKTKPKQRGKK